MCAACSVSLVEAIGSQISSYKDEDPLTQQSYITSVTIHPLMQARIHLYMYIGMPACVYRCITSWGD